MPRGEHRPSVLLSREENEMVFSMIGPKCQSLATAVVQLFTTEGPGHSEWKKRDTGVLCLIKDNGKRSYFFRIYCLYRKVLVWEHEVYLQIEYKSPRPFLHTFEAEEYMTAFNFANEDEARLLRTILIEKIELRKIKREGEMVTANGTKVSESEDDEDMSIAQKEYMTAFNFANEDEARLLRTILIEKIELRKIKREEKRQRALLAQRANSVSGARQNGAPPVAPPAALAPAPSLPPKAAPMTAGSTYTLKGSKKAKGRPKITKADIGLPQDFKHISHVGWDQHKGFDVDKLPNDELRSFFSMAGVSETQLEDEDTREFIYDFIETHGGIDAVKEDIYKPVKNVSRPMAVPTSAAPPVPARSPAPAHPPAPPSRAPPPPPARAVPPPPAPPAAHAPHAPRNPPPPRPSQPPSSAPPPVPPPPPPGVAPPPPPGAAPPAAPPPPPAPPAPPMPADAAVEPDARAALMESIRTGGAALRRVEPNQGSRPQIDDSRSNLLSEIRQGTKLKAVSRSTSSSGSSVRAEASSGLEHGLAGLLKRALDERNRAIHSDSDSDHHSDESNDDEWD